MKKATLVLVLVLFVAGLGTGFAQDSNTALHIDVGPTIQALTIGGIGLGLGLEFELDSSGGIYVGAQFITVGVPGASITSIVLIPEYRIYFLGDALNELYLGLGGIIGYVSIDTPFIEFAGLSAGGLAQLGYKANLGGFFLEPYAGLAFQSGSGFGFIYGIDLGFYL